MVTVSVEATWRLSRVELSFPHSVTHSVIGYGEVLLQEAAGAGEEAAAILRRPSTLGGAEPDPKTYGAMPGALVTRTFTPEVLAEEINIDGTKANLESVLGALAAFFEKWRIEDAAKPPTPLPEAAELTPLPPPVLVPDPVSPGTTPPA